MQTTEQRYLSAKRALFDKVYQSLNERQREAVYTINDPLLVLAGAGSGKTTVLVRRIAFIIRYGNAYHSEYVPFGTDDATVRELEAALSLPTEEIEKNILPTFSNNACEPYRILAITFTNKAANEIKERLARMFPEDPQTASDIWSGTFHSVCVRILRQHCELCGYRPGFTIYDTDDTKKSLLLAMQRCNVDEKLLPVKAVANAYFDEGLRLIELRKDQLHYLPEVMAKISGNPLKFIIFIDDLSFYQNDDNFGMLKAALEGSASAMADNAVIYATSNRRHIIKESFSDRDGDDVHRNDTMQETLSLSERFGLTVLFSKPNKQLYLHIVKELARRFEIVMDEKELEIQAEAFALRKGNRSARAAEQFINHLISVK